MGEMFAFTCPLKVKSLQINVTFILTDHLYPLKNTSILMGVLSSRMIVSPSTGDESSLNVFDDDENYVNEMERENYRHITHDVTETEY